MHAMMNIQDSHSSPATIREGSDQIQATPPVLAQQKQQQRQTPEQIGDEIRALFASNPDSNPFQIMLDRNN